MTHNINWAGMVGHRVLTHVTEGVEHSVAAYLREIEIQNITSDSCNVRFRTPHHREETVWATVSMDCLILTSRDGDVRTYEFIEDLAQRNERISI